MDNKLKTVDAETLLSTPMTFWGEEEQRSE